MGKPSSHEITRLFQEFADDRPALWQKLMPVVLPDIKRIVARRVGTRPRQPSEVTSVVHDVFLKVRDYDELGPDRQRFFAKIAAAVWQVIVDRARNRAREQRALTVYVPVENDEIGRFKVLDLHDALQALRDMGDEFTRWRDIIELHWWADLTIADVATLLGLSKSAVEKEKRKLLTYLRSKLA